MVVCIMISLQNSIYNNATALSNLKEVCVDELVDRGLMCNWLIEGRVQVGGVANHIDDYRSISNKFHPQ